MPTLTPNIIDDLIGNLLPHFKRQMAMVRRLRRRAGKIDLHADEWLNALDSMGTPLRTALRLYLIEVSELHMKIAFHSELRAINFDANGIGREILDVLAHISGGVDNTDDVVRRILSLEAHHFIPATGWGRFRALQTVFPDPGTMPAVNLLRFEHQGPIHLIERLANDAPGIIGARRNAVLTANMTHALNQIAVEVSGIAGLTEKQRALTYLDEIVTFYDQYYRDIGNGVALLDQAQDFAVTVTPRQTNRWLGWTARTWIDETKTAIQRLPGP